MEEQKQEKHKFQILDHQKWQINRFVRSQLPPDPIPFVKRPPGEILPVPGKELRLLPKFAELTKNLITEEVASQTYEDRIKSMEVHSMLYNENETIQEHVTRQISRIKPVTCERIMSEKNLSKDEQRMQGLRQFMSSEVGSRVQPAPKNLHILKDKDIKFSNQIDKSQIQQLFTQLQTLKQLPKPKQRPQQIHSVELSPRTYWNSKINSPIKQTGFTPDNDVTDAMREILKYKRRAPIPHDKQLEADDGPNELTVTNKILKNHANLKQSMNFRKDLDNEDEDSISDDDLVCAIKFNKMVESTKRADIVTEEYAVADVIEGVKQAAELVLPATLLPKSSIDIKALKERQMNLRRMIDEKNIQSNPELYMNVQENLPEKSQNLPQISTQSITLTPLISSRLIDQSPRKFGRSVAKNMMDQNYKYFDEFGRSKQIYKKVYHFKTIRSKPMTHQDCTFVNKTKINNAEQPGIQMNSDQEIQISQIFTSERSSTYNEINNIEFESNDLKSKILMTTRTAQGPRDQIRFSSGINQSLPTTAVSVQQQQVFTPSSRNQWQIFTPTSRGDISRKLAKLTLNINQEMSLNKDKTPRTKKFEKILTVRKFDKFDAERPSDPILENKFMKEEEHSSHDDSMTPRLDFNYKEKQQILANFQSENSSASLLNPILSAQSQKRQQKPSLVNIRITESSSKAVTQSLDQQFIPKLTKKQSPRRNKLRQPENSSDSLQIVVTSGVQVLRASSKIK